MTVQTDDKPWDRLRELADSGATKELEAFVDSLVPSEAVRAILRLDRSDQQLVLTTLTPAEAAELIEDIPDEHAADLIEALPPDAAAPIVSELPSDEQADLLGDLGEKEAEAILDQMAPAAAEDARRLIEFPDDVAGGLMVTEFLTYPTLAMVRDVIDDLSANAEDYEDYDIQSIYVTLASGKLVGVVALRDLVLAKRAAPIKDIMTRSPRSVTLETGFDDLVAYFQTHEAVSVPVVDQQKRLVGVVLASDVLEAIAERSDSESMKLQGIVGGDEIRSMPVLARSKRRLSWLSINIVLNIIAASVIALYEDTLSAVVALAVFLPIVSDMSGCSGNQAVAVSLRELSLGIVKPFEIVHVWLREILVGVINGIALGCLLAIAAWLWKGNPYLGAVAGGALAINTIAAVSIGGTVPLLLKRVGVDPAVASSPILTTITDMLGFWLVLSFATLLLPVLAAH